MGVQICQSFSSLALQLWAGEHFKDSGGESSLIELFTHNAVCWTASAVLCAVTNIIKLEYCDQSAKTLNSKSVLN